MSKLTLLLSLLGTNRLSIAQVERLLDLFGFESNRLDVAKFLYPLLVEKNLAAVGRIQSKFGFSSTKTTFTEWVSKQPK